MKKLEEALRSLLAIDPGFRRDRPNLGWALFIEGGLWSAASIKSKGELPNVNSLIIIEAPRWYPREHRADTNDLLDLSVFVGQIKGMYEERGRAVQLVWPRSWKGTVPKDIHNERVLAALKEAGTLG